MCSIIEKKNYPRFDSPKENHQKNTFKVLQQISQKNSILVRVIIPLSSSDVDFTWYDLNISACKTKIVRNKKNNEMKTKYID